MTVLNVMTQVEIKWKLAAVKQLLAEPASVFLKLVQQLLHL